MANDKKMNGKRHQMLFHDDDDDDDVLSCFVRIIQPKYSVAIVLHESMVTFFCVLFERCFKMLQRKHILYKWALLLLHKS